MLMLLMSPMVAIECWGRKPDDDRAAVGLGARVDFERGRERVRPDMTRGDCERVSDAEL
jgi:hypothetical protein